MEDGLDVGYFCLGSLESKVSLGELSQQTRLSSLSEYNLFSSVVV